MKYLLTGHTTERLLFRNIRNSDFDRWLDFHRDPDTSRHWKGLPEDPFTACTQWYEKQWQRYANGEGGMNAIVEKKSNLLAGHCGLLVQMVDGIEELEIAYSFLPAFWHLGYATEAAKKCKEVAFSKQFSNSLISIISLTNTASEKVALKLGMKLDKCTLYKGNRVNIFRIAAVSS